MPQIVFSEAAKKDLVRLREFLKDKDQEAAQRVAKVILASLTILQRHPESGRLVADMPPEYREWPIGFGDSGYIALYRYSESEQLVVILSIRHQKEAGFS